jgi:tetratricopeptide (TPR) repeat protein
LAWYDRGLVLNKLDRKEDAAKVFEQVHIDPKHTKAWKNLGMALDDIGRHEEAVKAYQQALKTNPNPK